MNFNALMPSPDLLDASPEEVSSAVETLCEMLQKQHDQLAFQHGEIESKTNKITSLEQQLAWLEEQLKLKNATIYRASSEKNPAQGEFFNEAEASVAKDLETDDSTAPDDADNKPTERAPRQSRQKPSVLNPDLPRERVEWCLSDEQRQAAVETFFEKVKEELHVIPAQFVVREYFQEKAVVLDADQERNLQNAPRPVHPLGKCAASTSLLAYILVNKYCDAMPLYRMNKVLKRHGACVSDTSLANWMVGLGGVLTPLVKLIQHRLMQGPLLQIDETPLQVIDAQGKKSWMWVIRGGPPDQPGVVFDFDLSRSSAVVERLIDDFNGHYIQCDGYSAYAKPCADKKLTRVGCFDHARRKFIDAQKTEPKAHKKTKPSKADMAIALIAKLYRIEREIKELDAPSRHLTRQEKSVPQLEKLHQWLLVNQAKVAKDSLIGKAVNYTLNQWPYLIAYTQKPYLPISNIAVENAIRPFAVGRRNWLFAKSESGAKASAVHYSLIENAKIYGIEPQRYIQYVLDHIGTATTEQQLDALLPWNLTDALATKPRTDR